MLEAHISLSTIEALNLKHFGLQHGEALSQEARALHCCAVVAEAATLPVTDLFW